MLLEYMRKNTKRFLYVVVPLIVVSFILWGTIPDPGTRNDQTLVEIGEGEISYQEFVNYYRNLRRTAQANFGGSLSPEIEKLLNLKQQALDGLIRDTLLQQEVVRLGIVVSNQEVQDSLKRLPDFQTGGRFDPVKWNTAISNPANHWVAITEQQRRSLSIQKLGDMIRSGARVSEEEIREEYRRQNEKIEIEFVGLKAGEIAGGIELSEGDLASYYDRHKQEYAEPAKVKLGYVKFGKEPSETDYEDAKEHAGRILERVQTGDDFAELAGYYSDDDATKGKGGDLGFFGRGRMVKEFEEVAFSMEPGEVSEAVKSQFGYHIIKVEETRGEGEDAQVSARHILVKVEPSDDTLISIQESALRLASAAADSSIEHAAEALGLDLSTTPLFPESGSVIPGVGLVREITEILPGLHEGKPSDMIEAGDAFYIVEVTERVPERIPELSEVAERVRAAAKAEKSLEIAKAKAEKAVTEINENGTALSDIEGLPDTRATEPFTRRGYPPELPYIGGLTDIVLELEEGQAAGPFVSGDVAYVFVSKSRIPADPDAYEDAKESIEGRILAQRRQQLFEDHFEALREEAGVKINEELFQNV